MRLIRTLGLPIFIVVGVFLATGTVASDRDTTLRGKSVNDVLACAKDKLCASQHSKWELEAAMSERKNIPALIDAYKSANDDQRAIIVMALCNRRDSRVETFMRRIAFKDVKPHEPDSEPQWYPLQNLARACDQSALGRLSRPENIMTAYPVGCIMWQDTVKAFGDCDYRPAIPYLIEALNTACVNIDDNAAAALEKFLPGECKNTKWPEPKQQCYRRVAQKHGYKTFQ